MSRNNDPGYLTLDVVRRPATDISGSIEVIAMSLVESVRSTTELEMTNRPGGLTSTPSRIPGSVSATIRISSDVITIGAAGQTDFHSFNRKTQLGFLKGMEGATVTAYARSLPSAGFLGKIRSVAIDDDQSNDQSFTATVQIRQVFQFEGEGGRTALGGEIRLPALPAREPGDSEENANQEEQPKGTGNHKCLTVFNKKLNRNQSILLGTGLAVVTLGAATPVAKRVGAGKWIRSAVGSVKREFRKANVAFKELERSLMEESTQEARKKPIRFGECEN